MASRNFYFQVIFRILILTITSIIIGFSYVKEKYILLGIMVILMVVQVTALIKFINATNRKIAYFFDAIKNEDFTLRFPERVNIKSFKELNQSLNRVNNLIQEVHVQLQTRENYYQEILKQARIGIMTFNEKGHILFSNPVMETLVNHSPLNHIRQLNKVNEELFTTFKDFIPFERKLFQLTNEREQKQLALKATPIALADESLLLVVGQDIHHELDEKETESWVRLIRVLTHEIMNSIAPITSISESVLKHHQKNDFDENARKTAVKGLQVIKEQSNDLMDFVQSYRSFLNVPKPDKEPVEVSKLFEKVELLTQREAAENITISWMVNPETLALFIDEKQLTQVLINLVKNAIHALETINGGKIKVNAGVSNSGKKFIEVLDNGPGINQETMENIFVPFFTTKEKGTGIGLSLSKQIMHLHGGDIRVHSILDKETRFTLIFNS